MADDDHGDDFADGEEFEERPLDEHEATLVHQDLHDLVEFEETFRPEGYRGVSVFCQDCDEEHYYEWDMLRENLRMLIESGETPVHEPAFAPDPGRYIPWDYARGYVDALRDSGVHERFDVGICPRCGFALPDEMRHANFCPRCATPLLLERLTTVLLQDVGLDEDVVARLVARMGLPVPRRVAPPEEH